MVVRIGDVWDRTMDVLGTRAAAFAPVALLAFWLPGVAEAAIGAFGGKTPAAAMLAALVGLAALVIQTWGQLAIVALAGEPVPPRAEASAVATRRLPRALLVLLVYFAAAVVAVLPIVVVLAASGFDWAGAAAGRSVKPPAVAVAVSLLYTLALLPVALWLIARLVLVMPVIVAEGRGFGAFGRSFRLTRGLALKLIGFLILVAIVWGVAGSAVHFILFLPLRLVTGPGGTAAATFVAGIGTAALSAVATTALSVFTARLYLAVAPRTPAA
jgi:hypothetical protein